jgi:hypothetical protein
LAAIAITAFVLPGMAHARPFTDYFKPTPIVCPPTSNIWGDKAVLPRDTCNGLEDTTGTPSVRPKWMYWDGKILRGADGKYHMYSSRWAHANGMGAWVNSEIIHATSAALLGPYTDQGFAYEDGPDSKSLHKGHNVTAAELPDGTYCLIVNEIVPFTIFTSDSPGGPWKNRGHAAFDNNGVQISIPQPGDQHLESNVSFVVRHDGTFQVIQRHGIIATSNTLLGPYKIQKPTTTYPTGQTPPSNLATVFPNRPKHLSTAAGAPSNPESVYVYAEDPIIWYSGGQYHVIYNYPDDRVAYHLTSKDGIHDWTDQGFAFDPRDGQKIFTNSDGSATRWWNVERPNVIMENGHVAYFTFAVSDVFKMGISGNSNNNTKVVVVAFDGVRFDEETGIGGVDGGVGGADGGGGSGGTGGASATGGRGGMDGGAGGGAGRDAAAADGGGSSTGGTGGSGGSSATSSRTGGTSVIPSSTGGASAPRSSSGSGASGGSASGGRGGSSGLTSAASGTAGSGGSQASGGSSGREASGGGASAKASGSGSSPQSEGKSGGCALAGTSAAHRGSTGILLLLCALGLVRRRARARLFGGPCSWSFPGRDDKTQSNEPKPPFPRQS